jgi:transcriptional regulator with XRE-family HTH domain
MASRKLCPVCSSQNIRVEYPPEYNYEDAGLSGVVLRGRGVQITRCGDCGNETSLVRDEQQLLQVLGLSLLVGPPGLTGEGLRYLRTLFGISQAALAKELCIPRRETIAEWEAKSRIFSRPHEEIGLRIFLLELYRKNVVGSEYCFLVPEQVAAFDKFVMEFVTNVTRVLQERTTSRNVNVHLSVKRLNREARWRLEPAAA